MTQHSVRVDDLNEVAGTVPSAPKYGRIVVGFEEDRPDLIAAGINGWLLGHPGSQIVHLTHASTVVAGEEELFWSYSALVEFLYLVEEA